VKAGEALRELSVDVVIIDQSQTDLLQIVTALHSPRGLPRRLDCRKKQPDENTDDRDHNEQFDEREPFSGPPPLIDNDHENLTRIGYFGVDKERKVKTDVPPDDAY
jgi:hypothetical protein